MTQDALTPQFRAFYVFVLVALWVAATLANMVSVLGLPLDMTGLVGISLFLAGLIFRTVREMILNA